MAAQEITIRGDGISVDLLLYRLYGFRGRELVETVLEQNVGIALLGPILPIGTRLTIPDLPTEQTTSQPTITLFG